MAWRILLQLCIAWLQSASKWAASTMLQDVREKMSCNKTNNGHWLMVAVQWVMWQIMLSMECCSGFRVELGRWLFRPRNNWFIGKGGGEWAWCRCEISRRKETQINVLTTACWWLLCGLNEMGTCRISRESSFLQYIPWNYLRLACVTFPFATWRWGQEMKVITRKRISRFNFQLSCRSETCESSAKKLNLPLFKSSASRCRPPTGWKVFLLSTK